MRPVRPLLAALLLPLLAGCGPQGVGDTAPADAAGITVLAAASLSDAFEDVADAFAASDGGVPVILATAGSQVLVAQVREGVPADVLATADATAQEGLAAEGLLAGAPEPFATNVLAIAVAPGNPRGVTGPADLARADLVVVLPDVDVPAGRAARAMLEAAGVRVTPASLTRDVRAALGAVALGEADAAVVYASDVAAAAGRVEGVEIPAAVNVTVTAVVGALADARDPVAAARFVAFLRSEEARAILADHGFGAP